MVQELQLTYRLVSDQDLQTGISQLENQMGALQPGTPEYEYDQLHLAYEERELEIREKNPDIDPTTQKGAQELAEIISRDPALQAINNQIQGLADAYPNKSTTWGIPM